MNKFKKYVFCKSCMIKRMVCVESKINKGIVNANFSCKYFIRDRGS